MTSELISLAKRFHLSVISQGKFSQNRDGLTGEEYLLELLRAEADSREKRAIAERKKQARLPTYKGFKEFDTDFQKGVTREQLRARRQVTETCLMSRNNGTNSTLTR